MTSISAGVSAFRETYVSAGDGGGIDAASFDFASYQGRRLRYALYQALFDASLYRGSVHQWSASMRSTYGLYRYIRAIENPASTIATFWQTHLLGGLLDREAGPTGALPIVTDVPDLRPAIAQLWQWSNWQQSKDVLSLTGALCGDVAIRVIDDRARQKVYLKPGHPSHYTGVTFDPFGNVRGYTYEEFRSHPDTGKTVVYREIVSRDGDDVLFETFLNGTPYAWPGQVGTAGQPLAAWREPYGFVPLVWINHIDTGQLFGLSELHAGLATFREVDDIASALDDQIRKLVNSPWLLSGVDDPKKQTNGTDPRPTTTPPTAKAPEAGRQDVPFLYAPVGASAQALVAQLDIAGVNERIGALQAKLRRDYPELDADLATDAGDASGRALRVKRQRAEVKVQLRRTAYDDAIVRAQQMALAIAGFRGMAGFGAFSLDSYAAGTLDHQIGARPVYAVNELDRLEEDTAFWQAAAAAQAAGCPLALWLADQGWDEQRIAALLAAKAETVSAPVLPPPMPAPEPQP